MKNITNIKKKNKLKIDEKKILGFWFYLMSDFIIFATLFSVYFVINNNTYVYNIKKNIFNLKNIFNESMLLLFSSFFYGIASIFVFFKKNKISIFYFIISFLLGLFFIYIEYNEYCDLIQKNCYPQKDSFFSIFFTLIGSHCLHVILGMLWMIYIIYEVCFYEIENILYNKIICLGLFWHFLDIIWVFIFNIVYLIGVI
ncbi:cytochrome c oxidase subunit 3 [Buchnera aphidicola (Taiwanaphis decaspermi)]|uniref:cytochrome c oxidase subunit 3 n=1 Tax=Buchnera aphidicola TaxID=9 RepID=UPI0031B8687D